MPASVRRVFKTKWFHKAAKAASITDADLCDAARQLTRGQGVDPGGNVWKKRLDKNRQCGIVLNKVGRSWIFVFLFAKRDRDNIDERELRGFRRLAADFDGRTDAEIAKLLELNELVEICSG
ncbi:addiction module toxin RelE [Burkholderia ubonensis]|uniref:Addiction module toxin RelE n=1 Tax=Burkholderia ubonensis TaxID=101571 RepID=A0A102K7M7_9BURK|nr:type II toxin-antitoxin system RelE/ParE family toxin [Burkholderia ubonensis]KUZ70159.1 addiction module toxin RelE [Burkholderia ubonensis]KUZ82511.1 addiction module toxin RelE [Burkholderia ubonensis]KUZ88751.1 addiction module toxin RelE [Burkholderia ubonensis]KUZ97254.1 addiction module toxin RelE [Burkholderia ubonensis]KVC70012.1 addiction module toxin RelE [Burkholderia ubonensis]